MFGYMVRRIGQAIIVLIGVTIITFILLHLLPGNPVRAILGTRASAIDIKQLTDQLGLNKPLYVQYFVWVSNLLHGNLGFSYKLDQPVASLLAQRIPKTLFLVGSSLILAVLLAVPLGMLQAVRRNKPDDYVLTGLSFIFYSMPSFWLGILLIVVFSATLGWFPSEAPQDQFSVFSQLNGMVLPVATLTLVTLAFFSRYTRSSMLEQTIQDYVRTARAKGVSRRAVLFRHVLRNALIPVITLLGLSLGGILSGAVVVEDVFNYPGMGLLFYQAAVSDDFPVLLGVTVVVALATVLGNLIADILYAVTDPRIRYVS
ncbi:MAG TPA: ABC transporter permease [Candidatus Nanopelagicaceae bacterium]|nr:ABC transporter permease [Candidatus Nanopelagicaceae bacterium]